MLQMEASRPYDLVLFGATGFTGGLTADYLAAHAPATMRWALAGRNRSRLDAVLGRIAANSPEAPIHGARSTRSRQAVWPGRASSATPA